MQTSRCVVALCLLIAVSGAAAVQLNKLDRSEVAGVHQDGEPVIAAAGTRIVSDFPQRDAAMHDVVFSEDDDSSALHQKVKRSHGKMHHHDAETYHRLTDEELAHETVARVTRDVPQLLQSVEMNIKNLREKDILGDLVNFVEVEDTSSRTLAILERMRRQMKDLDRRRAKLESVRDSIQLEIASKNRVHDTAATSPRPSALEGEAKDSDLDLDMDLQEWQDEAKMKQQQHDIGGVLQDADAMIAKLKDRVQVDYDSLTE